MTKYLAQKRKKMKKRTKKNKTKILPGQDYIFKVKLKDTVTPSFFESLINTIKYHYRKLLNLEI